MWTIFWRILAELKLILAELKLLRQEVITTNTKLDQIIDLITPAPAAHITISLGAPKDKP